MVISEADVLFVTINGGLSPTAVLKG